MEGEKVPPRNALRLALYVSLWYFITVIYNISNKVLLAALPLPATVAWLQVAMGLVIIVPLWARKQSSLGLQLQPANFKVWDRKYRWLALCHGLGNVTSEWAFSSGSIPFVHIVKATEPLFAAMITTKLLASSSSTSSATAPMSRRAFVSMLAICAGVVLTSAADAAFSWTSLVASLASNFFYQLRVVLAKREMLLQGDKSGTGDGDGSGGGNSHENSGDFLVGRMGAGDIEKKAHSPPPSTGEGGSTSGGMDAADLFRILTVLSAVQLLPVALVLEGHRWVSVWNRSAIDEDISTNLMLVHLSISGIAYFLYNEMSFLVLHELSSPISHAITNSMRRVVLVLVSMAALNSSFSTPAMLGVATALLGSLSYAGSFAAA